MTATRRATKKSKKYVSRATLTSRMNMSFLVFWGGFFYLLHLAFQAAMVVGEQLMRVKNSQGQSWELTFGTQGPVPLYLKCSVDKVCGVWANGALLREIGLWYLYVVPMVVALFYGLYLMRNMPPDYFTKDPGAGRWAKADDDNLLNYVQERKTGNKTTDEGNRRIGYLGYLQTYIGGDHFDDKKLTLLKFPMRNRCENVLVMGGVGAGKTRGYFRPNIMMDAHEGSTAIVYDLKYPQEGSGFFDLIGYWHRAGRRVQVFAPFDANSMRLPLLDDVTNFERALSLAKQIIAPPEFSAETGEHFKNKERRVLSGILLAVAQNPIMELRSLREVYRISMFTARELETWYKEQDNPEIITALKSIFDNRQDSIADSLSGIMAKLQIFNNENLNRATISKPGENLNLESIYETPTLLYVGIPQQYIMEGEGQILLQLIKRKVDYVAMSVSRKLSPFFGGTLPHHAAQYFDEFPSLGRLPYIMSTLGTLRSLNMSIHLGLQNSAQGQVVYGRDYYKAVSTNVIGHTVFFPGGINGDDAKHLSETLGDITVTAVAKADSKPKFFARPFDPTERSSESTKLEKRRLLAPEEFRSFRKSEAVILKNGAQPMRVWLAAPEDRFVGTEKVKNELNVLYKQVMGGVKNAGALSREVIATLVATKGISQDPESDYSKETPEGTFYSWLNRVLRDGVRIREQAFAQDDGRTKYTFHLNTTTIAEHHLDHDYLALFEKNKWINRHQGAEEISLTQAALKLLGSAMVDRLLDMVVQGVVLVWIRENILGIANHPANTNDPQVAPSAAQAVYENERLLMPVSTAIEIWGVVPLLPIRKLDNNRYVEIPLNDAHKLREAVQKAKLEDIEHPVEGASASTGVPGPLEKTPEQTLEKKAPVKPPQVPPATEDAGSSAAQPAPLVQPQVQTPASKGTPIDAPAGSEETGKARVVKARKKQHFKVLGGPTSPKELAAAEDEVEQPTAQEETAPREADETLDDFDVTSFINASKGGFSDETTDQQ